MPGCSRPQFVALVDIRHTIGVRIKLFLGADAAVVPVTHPQNDCGQQRRDGGTQQEHTTNGLGAQHIPIRLTSDQLPRPNRVLLSTAAVFLA